MVRVYILVLGLAAFTSNAEAMSRNDQMNVWVSSDAAAQLQLANNLAKLLEDQKPGMTGTYLLGCMNELAKQFRVTGTSIARTAAICTAIYR